MTDLVLHKLLENFDGAKIVLRPSSIDSFGRCPRKWAATYIGGVRSASGGRAAIGTAVHAAVELGWKDAMLSQNKDFNLGAMSDIAVLSLQEQVKEEGVEFDKGEDLSTAEREVVKGAAAFIEDVTPFVDIPTAVEQRYTMELDHAVAESLSGTVDYLNATTGVLADVKTSKRKIAPQSHATQQTIYKLLVEHNGIKVNHSMIHGVVLKKEPEGHVMSLESTEVQTKFVVNTLLDTLALFAEQRISPDLLFRGNTKDYLCSAKYCALHATCPYVQGAADAPTSHVKL